MSKFESNKLLNQIVKLYQNFQTYSDSGVASCEIGNLQFTTNFCRPNQYRFDWTSNVLGATKKGTVYSSDGTNAISIDDDGEDEEMSLVLAIAGATGVSFGVAPITAHLLMPNLFPDGQYQSFIEQGSYEILEVNNSSIKLRSDWRANCWVTIVIDRLTLTLREITEGFTPTLIEKQNGIEGLEGADVDYIKENLLNFEKTYEDIISFNDVKFTM